ncbi:hypothetical protein V8P77_08085, partial [Rhizobium sp. 1AS14I]
KWLRTATRRYRYHPKYRNQKPLERTQNWIKLGGKVTVENTTLRHRLIRYGKSRNARRSNSFTREVKTRLMQKVCLMAKGGLALMGRQSPPHACASLPR